MISSDLHNAISLQGLVDGVSLLPLPDGLRTSLYGPVPAPASLSVWPVKALEPTIIATSGLSSAASSRTVNLQQSLESRLRQQMDVNGSPEYALTWKRWDMESGPPICALRASQRRISDKDYTGWPTPKATDSTGAGTQGREGGTNLQTAASVAGWATPNAEDCKAGQSLSPNRTQRSLPVDARRAAIAGQITSGYPAPTEKRGVLNPELPRWLLGYPEGWGSYADTATRFVRK